VTLRALARLKVVYLALLVVICAAVHHAASLRAVDGEHVTSAWRKGELVGRAVNGMIAVVDGTIVVDEHVVGEAPILTTFEPVFALSVVAGLDGVKATWNGLTVYVTPDELLARQAYDKGIAIPGLALSLGVNVPLIEAVLAERLRTTVPELRAHARFARIRTEHGGVTVRGDSAATTPDTLTPPLLRGAALAAALHLARGVGPDGRFRYIVDAPTDRTLPGYDWPRHAGAAFFLAQATELSPDPSLRDAALRAGRYLRDKALDCGPLKCIGSETIVDVGSTALAVIAMSEFVRTGLDPSLRAPLVELTKFLRAQQRPDGEFMHYFHRQASRPIDVQGLYYSGEATLALARAHELTGDAADLDAARRGLANLVGPAWSFFGNRYYFGEEHWTCQAMSELWERAPNPKALDFCERWREYDAKMMYGPGETPWDADGAFGVGPVVTPRLTPVASRSEAGVVTLDAMARAGEGAEKRAALASQLRRSFALLLRQQLRPGRFYVFANGDDVFGGMPGSQVDLQLRIDYAQHTGSALIRAAASPELWAGTAAAAGPPH
jgi:hypothetical protein